MLSNIRAIFEGTSWGSEPTELSQCSAILEIHSVKEWNQVNGFIRANQNKNIAFLLTHQLKGVFSDYATQKHSEIDFPLAVLLAFEKASSFLPKHEYTGQNRPASLNPRLSQAEYLDKIEAIQKLIQKGEFYETNFCFEHFLREEIDPGKVYSKVSELSKAPYAAYLQYQHRHVISGSPELFFETEKNAIRCAPIKGTRPRSSDAKRDALLKHELENSIKERAENIMIADLVRHDLSQLATKNSVQVNALCKVHSFATVHQLITDISAQLLPGVEFAEVIEKLFPIGSMTGAPKIASVGFTDDLEPTPRVTYSGTLGWIKPNGDIVSSVLIRGIYYDALKKYTSVSVGGAITALSNPKEEYKECQTKLRMMQEALGQDQ